jgi:predicted transcriptional regulator
VDIARALEAVSTFRGEDEERAFWAKADSTEYVDWSKARRVRFSHLRPSTTTSCIRAANARSFRYALSPWTTMTPTTKDRVRALADQLPPEATLEDAIERLVFLTKIDRGLAEADAAKLVDHDDVEREFIR